MKKRQKGDEMEENLNNQYESVLNFLYYASSTLCAEYNVEIEIDIIPNLELNARVYQDRINTRKYHIEIFSGCLGLEYSIGQIITRFEDDDLPFFSYVKDFSIFDKNEDDAYIDTFVNMFSSVMLLHILFHECGHVIAGHLMKETHRFEFDKEKKGSYEQQEKEIVADWISTKYTLLSFLNAIYSMNIPDEEVSVYIKQVMLLFWVSLSIEFQIFDNKHINETVKNSERTHPHPSVRLFNCIEATNEAVYDFLIMHGLEKSVAARTTDNLILCMSTPLLVFQSLMETPIFKELFSINTIDYYIILREIPILHDIERKYWHLPQLSSHYRERAEQYISQFNS